MNFTAKLPNGMTKDQWIASLKPGTIFCTRRPQKCANCGENSLKHIPFQGQLYCGQDGHLPPRKTIKGTGLWQPLPPVLKVGCVNCGLPWEEHNLHEKGFEGQEVCPNSFKRRKTTMNGEPTTLTMGTSYTPKKFAICSGRGTGAICECGEKFNNHKINYENQDEPLCPASFRRFEGVKIGDGIPTQTVEYAERYVPLKCELVSVMDEEEWQRKICAEKIFGYHKKDECWNDVGYTEEAHREGFETWEQLDKWIVDYYGARPKMWRYCFKR